MRSDHAEDSAAPHNSSLVSPNFDFASEAADSTLRTSNAVSTPQSGIHPPARATAFADYGIPESSIFPFRPNTRNSLNSGRAAGATVIA